MKSYTKTYLQFFCFDESSFILCEVCDSKKATEIHHIRPRSTHKHLLNDITNLVAICRECHSLFGDRKQHREMIIEKHKQRMNENRH